MPPLKNTPRLPDDSVNLGDERPLREAALLVVAAIVLIFVSVAVLAALTDVAVGFVSRDTERAVFEPLLPMVSSMGGAGVAEEATAELERQVQNTNLGGPDLGYEYRVAISCDDDPNALALPGGGIVLTAGLLRLLSTENELTFVIGHEVGHFEHRDHLRGIGRGLAVSLVLGMTGFATDDALVQRAAKAALAVHGREQETRADEAGMAALQRRYGHVGGARRVMEKLAAAAGEGLADRLDYTRSHPVGAERTARMADSASEHGWRVDGKLKPLPEALRNPCPAQQRQPGRVAAPRG